ncbi:MAG: ABC transporter permease [Clostridiales bacterium]|nr:ABC transporter permease [Clostridiales bacterium]
MRPFDLLRVAFLNLWRRKLRAFLTVLGLVIGITAIVVMVSLGIGIEQATMDLFAGTGSLLIIEVSPWRWIETPGGGGTGTETKLDEKSVEAFRQIPGVRSVMPLVEAWGMITTSRFTTSVSILGVDEETAVDFGFDLAEGRLPTHQRGSRNFEMVFGNWVLDSFYNPKNGNPAIDREGNSMIKMTNRFRMTFDWMNIYDTGGMPPPENYSPGRFYNITPVGRMDQMSNRFSFYSLMDVNALEQLIRENRDFIGQQPGGGYNQVLVKCDDLNSVASVKMAIDAMEYGTFSMLDAVNAALAQTRQQRMLLGAIGGVALLVAAIGIMNTMMMSIYERTREIGIIKVLGCRMGNIVTLFLAEAMLIGLAGGVLGLGLSYLVSFVLNVFREAGSNILSIIPTYLAFGAVAFSVFVAMLFGLYPAIRAMRLSALAAIRNE